MSNQWAERPGLEDLVTMNRSATVARLVSSALHKLNNDLQVIGGTTELLQGLPGLPPEVAGALERIRTANGRAAR